MKPGLGFLCVSAAVVLVAACSDGGVHNAGSGASAGAAGSAGGGASAGAAGSAGSGTAGSGQGGSGGAGCAASCTGTCTAGRCLETLYSGSNLAVGLAVDATDVYWTDGLGALMKVPLSGGTVTTLVQDSPLVGGGNSWQVAMDATGVYFPRDDKLLREPLGGGTPATLASGLTDFAVALDATSAYYIAGLGTGISLTKVPVGGGTPVALATAPFESFASDGTNVYYITYGNNDAAVMKVPVTGGTPVTLASARAFRIALGPSSVYWTNLDNGKLMKVAKSGGTPVMLAAGQQQTTEDAIAADATNVYWSAEAAPPATMPQVLRKVPASGGTPVVLASQLDVVKAIAVDATSVYWSTIDDQNHGALMKLTPK